LGGAEMTEFERDISRQAEEWALKPGRAHLLPIMNFAPPGTPAVGDPAERYRPPAPRVFDPEQLVDYALTIGCHCGHQTELIGGNVAKLIAQAGRVSFQHLLTTLTCGGCGGSPNTISVVRECDRGLRDAPKQTFEAPMCGRYTFTKSVDEIRSLFGFHNSPNLEPRYNIAPSQMAPAIAMVDDAPKLGMLKWGLIPSWAKDAKIGFSNINARVETVAEKPAFRSAFKVRHCLILADGFYEWEPEGKPKQPWRFTLPDGRAFAFAGLWEKWKDPAGETITSFTIITREPYRDVAPVHNRSPIILEPEAYVDWLTCQTTEPTSYLGVKQYEGPLRAYKVSPAVNNAKNNDHPGLIEPLKESIDVR